MFSSAPCITAHPASLGRMELNAAVKASHSVLSDSLRLLSGMFQGARGVFESLTLAKLAVGSKRR